MITIAALALACAGCPDRRPPTIGIAMGADVGTPQAILPGRQQRFNESVGARRQVTLRIGKDSAEAAQALVWANELVRIPGLIGVIGHESSRSALQAAPVYHEHGVVQIVPTGTSRKLATVSPWTFPLVASDSLQGELLAGFLARSGRKRLTLLVQDDEYGRGIVSAIKAALVPTDVQILENVMHTPQSDLNLLVRSILSHDPKPDMLLLVTQGGLAERTAKLAWARDPNLLIVGSDATISGARELRTLAPASDRLALATYWLPDSTNAATQKFLSDFRASHLDGEPLWNHAALYDAVGILNTAAAEVGGDPRAVRDWMLSLGRTRPPYQGVLGAIDFTGKQAIAARLIRPSATGWELVK
ncbi:MAG: ABC transporter substrate-binding protein [Gemmatimonas sp.]